MLDSDISSLNSSLFTSNTNGWSTITGPVAQHIQNKDTWKRDLRVPRLALIPTRQPQQPPDLSIARQSLAPVFVAGNTKFDLENPLLILKVTQKVLHQIIGILDNYSNCQLQSDIIL